MRANRLMKAIRGSRASRVWRAREVVESRGDEVSGKMRETRMAVDRTGKRMDGGGSGKERAAIRGRRAETSTEQRLIGTARTGTRL